MSRTFFILSLQVSKQFPVNKYLNAKSISILFHRNPKMIIRELGMNLTNYEVDVSIIFIHLLIFKICAYVMLKRRLQY